jgi:hypothetical protein
MDLKGEIVTAILPAVRPTFTCALLQHGTVIDSARLISAGLGRTARYQ